MYSYTCYACHLTRAAIINERTRQRMYLHSTFMRPRPSYSVDRSEPVRNFDSRRYNSNVRFSVKLETRQPHYCGTHKHVRFYDSDYEHETRYPAQGSSRGYEFEFGYPLHYSSRPRSQNTRDSSHAGVRLSTPAQAIRLSLESEASRALSIKIWLGCFKNSHPALQLYKDQTPLVISHLTSPFPSPMIESEIRTTN
ncbi:hypothetical protein Pdw03_2891 [Penicillium digitatum]|uniref:Uncharacterized protein n=1 Tax=Penicillium digitatum TaxID=36651 RepID=A0A7T6XFB3_PENDI|nr:hypothetical protein Pdw03_2891 [Penicillium digitatum]